MKQCLHKKLANLKLPILGGASSKVKVKCYSFVFCLNDFILTVA